MKNTTKKSGTTLGILAFLFLLAQTPIFAQSSQEQGIKVQKKTLETYLGSYQMQENSILKITLQGDSLKAEGPGYPPLDLIPITNSRFFLKKFGVDIEFVKNDKNKIIKLLMIREDGQQLEAIRVEKKDGK